MGFMAFDTLRSLVTGLGTSKDKSASLQYALRVLDDGQLNAMHRSDWLARKIVDIVPDDMTREWRNWQADGNQIEEIEKVEKDLRIRPKLTLALQKARLFGGAAIYLGIRGQDPTTPLVLDTVGRGALEYVHVLHRHELTVMELVRDVTSPFYGEPAFYEVRGPQEAGVRVHPSRMIRLVGAPILDDRATMADGWGDSVLQIVYDAVVNATSVQSHVAALVQEAKSDVIYIPNLSEYLRDPRTTRQLTDRFTYANTMKSMFNMILLQGDGREAGEKWEQKQISFTQMPEIMRSFFEAVSGAADIPLTRLLGEAPSGLGSNGEHSLKNYYDHIRASQHTDLTPALDRLDECLIRSAIGSRDPSIYYEWAPLYTMSEKEKAETFKMKADAARAIAGSAVGELIPIEALSDALVNSIIEDGDLPGMEAAIEEFGRLADQPEEDPIDIQAAMVPPVPPVPPQQIAQDAAPRSLYVSRAVVNSDEIVRWAKAQGFKSVIGDLHVTITFSRTPVDWFKVGEPWQSKMTVPAGGPRQMERFGDATVLLFSASELRWRHDEMVDAGASWDHEEYQPHITISKEAGDLDLSKVVPYQGEIVLGPEAFAEVEED